LLLPSLEPDYKVTACSDLNIVPRLRSFVAVLALTLAACGEVGISGRSSTPSAVPGSGTLSVSPGTATLNWTPVTQNTDGSVLTDLAGYKVYYGTFPNAMNTLVVLPDPTQTTYVVTNLSSGAWYFAVAAYTSSGIQGVLSNVASKTVN
jgi:hypothetical protein